MKRNSKQQHKAAFHQNLKSITLKQIESMTCIDSEDHIRFLKDPKTGLFVVFNGKMNQTFYSSKYKVAERLFQKLINSI